MNEFEICQCKGCERPALYLGMCNRHWRRTRIYGSPFAVRSHSGMMKGLTAIERFNKQHKKTDNCWIWTAATDQDGYGKFRGEVLGTVFQKAHRFSWAYHSQSLIPAGMLVCHTCDNPRCVNPGHLWLGTEADNHDDMVAKGRRRTEVRGELASRAKLTEDQVRAILADPRPYAQIAADYGVASPTITSVKNRDSWAHVEVHHVAKNKRGSGSGHRGKSTRITPDIVRDIRASAEMGKDLAAKYNVSKQLITAIRKRRAWAHVD